MVHDLRLAFRQLLAKPGFAVVAVLTLSLGIGATTAIFSVVRAVLLRPLDYPQAEQLVKLTSFDRADGEAGNLSPADFFDFARDSTVFERAGANGFVGLFTMSGGAGAAERVGGVNVTDGFFATLGVQPALGRGFTADDDRPGAPVAVLLSDGFWRRRYGADPSIVGATMTLNAAPATVVGVLPAGYRHVEVNPERPADLFVPYRFDRGQANRGGHFIRGVARLKAGATVEQAQAELGAIAARLEQQYPGDNTNLEVRVTPLLDAMVAGARPVLLLLSAAVVFVLLVACANVANLLLARGTGRLRELALRAAIGADRGRLVRQMLTESAALSLMGAAGGLLVAWWAMRGLTALAASGMPRAGEIRIDGPVLLFALGAALGTSVIFGLLPALQLSRHDLHDALKEGGRHPSTVVGRGARELLIVGEVALSIVLLVGAGLLVRSVWQLQQVDPGFSAAQVLAMEVAPPLTRYPEGDQMPFYQRLETRVRALPGVTGVGAINILPLSSNYDSRGIQIEDRPVPAGQGPGPQARSVTTGYFQAMGIPLTRGRAFDARDGGAAPLVVIVSESMARKYWPGEDPIGKRITFNSGIPRERQQVVGGPGSRVVVGVAGDVKHLGLDEGEVPMFYTPHTQQPSYHTMRLVVRSASDPAQLTGAVRAELQQLDREVPLSQVTTLGAMMDKTVAAPRLRATLLGLFAMLALSLAAIGVYGVVAYLVGQRTQEIGVRLALGAGAADVLYLLMGEALRPVALGMAIGVGGAIALARLIGAMLFGVSATDVGTYVAACAVLGASAALATLIPARRALAVDAVRAIGGS